MLLGREQELSGVQERCRAAADGRGSVLVVVGAAGIGKTALIEAAAAQFDARVVRTVAVEAEQNLAFATLQALLWPLRDRFDELERGQAELLRGIVRAGPAHESSTFAVAAGTLALVSVVAEPSPLLLLVDDAHWADRASQEVLRFVGRRLEHERVALIAAVREGEPSLLEAERSFGHLEVGPLEQPAARELLASAAPSDLAPAVADALLEACAGSPLGLIELPQLLSEAQRRALEPLPSPLHAGPLVRAAFATRWQRLGDEARRALLLFAAAGEGEPSLAERSAVPPHALDELEASGLVTRGPSIAFRHPLMRAAVYGEASLRERRAAHGDLAAATDGARRAWHLAAAADGPDEAVAEALEQAARDAGAQGGVAPQAEALERAADLTPAGDERSRRLVEAARAWRRAGLVERAQDLLEQALPLAGGDRLRAEIQLERGLDLLREGAQREAYELLVPEASRVEKIEPDLAARLYSAVAFVANVYPDAPSALPPAERALELSGRRGDAIELEALFALITARFRRPVPPDAEDEALVDRAAGLLRHPDLRTAEHPHWIAYTLAELERDAEARALSDLTLGENRAAGDLWSLCYGCYARAVIEAVCGRIDVASAWAAEALPLAEQIGEVWRLHETSIVQGEIDGLRGDVAACRDLPVGPGNLDLHLGRALLGAGEAEEATPLLERAAERAGAGTPRGWFRLIPIELAEAYALTGRTADAERLLRSVASGIESCPLLRPQARLARVRGLFATEARVDATFGEAVALLERRPNQHEQARVELNWGERLRRAGRSRDAAVHLERAVARFDALGCVGWADRSRRELEATGTVARRAAQRRTDALTAQELRIARHAGAGLRDREIAAALYLSPRTVESHLQHAYRKLGVSNRTQLAAVLAADWVRPLSSAESSVEEAP